MSLTSWSAECTQSYEKFSCNAHLYRHVGNHHCLKLVKATQCQQRHSNIARSPGTTITVVLWFPAILYYLILPDEASTDTTAEVITTISLLLCVCINSGKNLGLLLVLQICTNYLPHFVTFSGSLCAAARVETYMSQCHRGFCTGFQAFLQIAVNYFYSTDIYHVWIS